MGKHYTPIATKIIGVDSAGESKDLIYIDEVEEYLPQGDYKSLIRGIVLNHKENTRDSFYFDQKDNYKLIQSFIQTSEATMELLTLYMMKIQSKTELNEFVVEAAKKLRADFGYRDIQMVDNSITTGDSVEN